jgi:hypothetical protein
MFGRASQRAVGLLDANLRWLFLHNGNPEGALGFERDGVLFFLVV